MALPLFAITLFVSAFLLFLVQPMIGKMILPKLGGTPQVWNTCCMFFQTVLLLGYFYTHATTHYLKPRRQMLLHGVLLFLPLILLLAKGPFDVRTWDPPAGGNPIWQTLLLLAIIVGIPFFVVSTSAPLLQKWFSFSGHPTASDPYFLYGASNLGSLLSLIAYPFVVERSLYLSQQAWLWTGGYALLVAMVLASAALVWKSAVSLEMEDRAPTDPVPDPLPAVTATPTPATSIQPGRPIGKKKGLKSPAGVAHGKVPEAPSIARVSAYDPVAAPVDFIRCIRWIGLAAVPSSLMLGVTTYVSTDLSPFPLLWVIPLSFYLLSFILVFAKWPIPWTGSPHQLFLLVMPFFVIALSLLLFPPRDYSPGLGMWVQFISVFIITTALHGELAKDRPAPRHLTLFFLLMSFGGMLGGTFNALFAPVIFTSIVEYPLAIFLATLLRSNMTEAGWLDGMLLQNPNIRESAAEASDNFAKSFGRRPTGSPFLLSYAIDIGVGLAIGLLAWVCISNEASLRSGFISLMRFLGLGDDFLGRNIYGINRLAVYGLPFLACLIVLPRSLRFAIGLGLTLWIGLYTGDRERSELYAGRSYFGVLRVYRSDERGGGSPPDVLRDNSGKAIFQEAETLPPKLSLGHYNYLMHGSTYHGRNYFDPPELSRLATTYYHRFGPVGAITEKYNWFPGPQNTYWADARLPISMIGLGATQLAGLPTEMLSNVWSEPAFGTVGLGTGTMASYSRWLQHMTYYEIDDKIRNMNVPPEGKAALFVYVKEASERGANIEIIMGDARQSLEREDRSFEQWQKNPDVLKRGPNPKREKYFKFLNLDAFSSDAIPVHLITEEAIKLYMSKLTDDGVLMVHTSNRHMDLVGPVADICRKLGLDAVVGKDEGGAERRGGQMGPGRIHSLGHFGSEYVMVARKGILDPRKLSNAVQIPGGKASVVRWERAVPPNREVWTDHYQDIIAILR